ncbi:hypothetical protein ABZ912_50270 [Nonomuraea angiospora]|uniref:hypothetical protein n=1 Tax=Nonomuraea angiospora TaxID=46172 RepID=UPI0033C64BC6
MPRAVGRSWTPSSARSRTGDFAALLAVLDPEVVYHDDAAAWTLRGADAVVEHAMTYTRYVRFVRLAQVDGDAGLALVAGGRSMNRPLDMPVTEWINGGLVRIIAGTLVLATMITGCSGAPVNTTQHVAVAPPSPTTAPPPHGRRRAGRR